MKNKLFILFIFLFAFSFKGWSDTVVDSLKKELEKTDDPSVKFDIYYKISKSLSSKKTKESRIYYLLVAELNAKVNTKISNAKTELLQAIIYYEEDNNIKAGELFKKVIPKLQANDTKQELADVYAYTGLNYMAVGDYISAIENFERGSTYSEELNDEGQVAENNMYIGRSFQGMGNIPKALEYFQSALGPAENLKKDRLTTQITLFIGALYTEGVNDKVGMEYLTKAAARAEKAKDTSMLLNAYTFIANQYYYDKKYKEALEKYEKILSFSSSHGNKHTYAGVLGNIGNVYADMGQIEKGMEYQMQSVEIFKELGDRQGLTICYSGIGINYLNLKQYDKALEYFNKSLPMAQEMQSWEDLIEIHQNLSRLYEETHDYEKAFSNYKLYKAFNDSVFNSANAQKITEMELNYQFEGKEKEAALLQELTNERFKRTVYVAISGGLILLIIVFLVARANRQRKRTNEQLTISNNAVLLQKEELETHKKEITDSINYAKRIQESILPPESYWKNCLADSFIFYRPKDIVSGDFYWVEQKNDVVCFAAVDCTGHGVPGALMSVVGFNLLTQAVNEMSLTVPSEILKHLDHGVTKTLRQSEDGKGVKDGMDLSLCSLNLKTNELQYAGAYNSLYYVANGILHEVKSDKFPIGVNIDGKVDNYTNHSIQLKKGDCVYLFSDGYADQFGGPKGKKFKYNQLKEILHKNYVLPIEEQKEQLSKAFDSWKGELEQVDDVVIIGVRV